MLAAKQVSSVSKGFGVCHRLVGLVRTPAASEESLPVEIYSQQRASRLEVPAAGLVSYDCLGVL